MNTTIQKIGNNMTNVATSLKTNMDRISNNKFIIFYSIFSTLTAVSLFVTFFLSGISAWGMQVSGYGLLFFAMLALLGNFYYLYGDKNSTPITNAPPVTNIKPAKIFVVCVFMFIMIGTIFTKLYSLFAYKDRIILNEQYYDYFNGTNVGLIVLQIIAITYFSQQYGFNSNVVYSLLLLSVLMSICVITDFVVIAYFHADGFCSVCHK
jgi:hypothetical protein